MAVDDADEDAGTANVAAGDGAADEDDSASTSRTSGLTLRSAPRKGTPCQLQLKVRDSAVAPLHERLILLQPGDVAVRVPGRTTATTEAKAKRLRPFAERLITFAKRGDFAPRTPSRDDR
jgi:hypothetical protein